jgi:UDP-N-acetylmuramate dehydrogenase
MKSGDAPFSSDAQVLRDEPMSKHTTWRVGGRADVYYSPRCRADLLAFLCTLGADTPVYWVGLGSNVLVRDGGIRGVVIATGQALGEVRNLGKGRIEAGAGVPCTVLARQCSRWQLGPAEFFAGIPGTVGGALRMNAGAFGGETWSRVTEVDLVNRRGEVVTRSRDDFVVGYREVQGPEAGFFSEWGFLAARMSFDEHYESAPERIKGLLAERQQRQPLGLPSCGSVFRNPPGDFAARLIETAGLKGARVGGAEVSAKHANFIINTGAATAADVEALLNKVRDTVAATHGVRLVPEVHILGEAGDRP